jgi:hypothetical protein
VTTQISRRTWWTVTAGSLAAAASAAFWWKRRLPGIGAAKAPPVAAYVDHDGWMLTAKEKARLTNSPPPQ